MKLHPGKFRMKARGAQLAYTKDDNDQVAVELVALDPDYAGESITWFGSFAEKAFDITISSLRNAGWQGDDLGDLSSVADGQECVAVLVEDEYEGKLSLKVRWINAAGGVAVKKPMSDDQARSFGARMRSLVIAHDRAKGTAPSASGGRQPPRPVGGRPAANSGGGYDRNRPPQAPPHTDDDIPF